MELSNLSLLHIDAFVSKTYIYIISCWHYLHFSDGRCVELIQNSALLEASHRAAAYQCIDVLLFPTVKF